MKYTLLPLALALLAPLAAAAPDKAPRLLFVQTESRIEVDAQGNITAIRTTPQLPPEVEAVVHDNLRKLRFAPPMKDGRPVAGVTFASQDACAAPVDGRYTFAVKYRGNGPSMDRSHPPVYPRELERRGIQSKWTVEYAIAADGHASVVGITRREGGDGNRGDAEFRKVLTQWIEGSRFSPEQLDGQPVATRMSTKVDFVLDTGSPAALRAKANAGNDACKLALDARDGANQTVALDSPFKLEVAAN
jgi:hypothetical protein